MSQEAMADARLADETCDLLADIEERPGRSVQGISA
jgi:hypothetical protein